MIILMEITHVFRGDDAYFQIHRKQMMIYELSAADYSTIRSYDSNCNESL